MDKLIGWKHESTVMVIPGRLTITVQSYFAFFGRKFFINTDHIEHPVSGDMTGEYMNWVRAGYDSNRFLADYSDSEDMDVLYACHAMSAELGEVSDVVLKSVRLKQPYDKSDLFNEIGDVTWGYFLLLSVLGITLSDVIQINRIKLTVRHPSGDVTRGHKNKALEASKINEYLTDKGIL